MVSCLKRDSASAYATDSDKHKAGVNTEIREAQHSYRGAERKSIVSV